MATCDYGCCPREVRDWFCGAGGAAEGLHRAWPHAHIVGYDIRLQPRYPFDFVLGDAMEAPFGDFTWVSAPCQDHMRTPLPGAKKHGTGWLLGAARERLLTQQNHYAMENVPGAPMRVDYGLCGCMFGLRTADWELRRVRWFEVSWPVPFTLRPPHVHLKPALAVVGNGQPSYYRHLFAKRPDGKYDYAAYLAECKALMGIDWMTRDELSQAVPPAYSEYIARQLTPALTEAVA